MPPPPASRFPPFSHMSLQQQQQSQHQSSHLQQPQQQQQHHLVSGSSTSPNNAAAFNAHHAFGSALTAAPNGATSFMPQSGAGTSGMSGGSSAYGASGAGSGLPSGLGGGLSVGAGMGGARGVGSGQGQNAVQMGFGGGVHPSMMGRGMNEGVGMRGEIGDNRIVQVWANNIKEQFKYLQILVRDYTYISMDTEFPGVIARPIADRGEDFGTKSGYHYQLMRSNVDLTELVQLGITLFNEKGETPPSNALDGLIPNGGLITCPTTWCFNFKFDLDHQMSNEDSIAMLRNAGCDFERMPRDGIPYDMFSQLFIPSGLPYFKNIHWISFHSGYDFGYLMRLMWNRLLPKDDEEYRRLLKKHFPNIWDAKYMIKHVIKLHQRGTVTESVSALIQNFNGKNSLQDVADELGCQRVGTAHTAGSDAWLTGLVFFQMRRRFFDGKIPEELNGQMWGLTNSGPPASAAMQAHTLQMLASNTNSHNGSSFNAFLHRDNVGPSTPTATPAGLASQTPGQQGFTTGVFGNFTYAK